MARNMETLILLLDVSPSMHPYLKRWTEMINELMTGKLLFNTHDEVAVIAFGTDETKNEVNEELGEGYENITVMRIVKPIDNDIFTVLRKIRGGKRSGDFLNCSVVAIDAMMKARGRMKKGNKRVLLITNAGSPLEQPALEGEGESMEDQIDRVAKQFVDQGVKLDVFLSRLETADGSVSGLMEENEIYLNRLVTTSLGNMQRVTDVDMLRNKLKPRVAPTSSYRGELELTPHMKIKIWIYKKTLEQHFPSLGIYSDQASVGESSAIRQAKVVREHKLSTDADVIVPPDLQVKAYRYGPQLVPISALDKEALMFKVEKGFKLLGFASREEVPRHYFMKDVSLVIPDPGEDKAVTAVSALSRALHAKDKVAIVRFKLINREDQGVAMGVLTPCLVDDPNLVDAFYLNSLPFSEDIRETTFPSLSDRLSDQQPSVSQKAAALLLVQSMDLSHQEKMEDLRPDDTPNPVLQRYYKFVHQKYLNREASVPPLDQNLRRIVESQAEQESMAALKSFRAAFPLVPSDKRKGGFSQFWNKQAINGNEGGVSSEVVNGNENRNGNFNGSQGPNEAQESEVQGNITLENLSNSGPVESVGSSTPVEDFKAMLERRDGADWVPKAILGMREAIQTLLTSSYKGSMYSKALSALSALREGCVTQQEPGMFNEFLRNLATYCRHHGLDDFWDLVASSSLSLISSEEAPDSDVSEVEAKSFLEGGKSGFDGEGVALEGDEDEDMEHLLSAVE